MNFIVTTAFDARRRQGLGHMFPATLLLRPFGWDTLAVRIYELTAEGEWQRAAALW